MHAALSGFRSAMLFLLLAATTAAQAIPIMQITGRNNHDWEHTAAVIEAFLEATGRFNVTTVRDPATALADRAAIEKYRGFILNDFGPRWGEPAESNFMTAVREGRGVIVVHAANNAFPGWNEYETMIGLGYRDGAGHGSFHAFDVDVVDRNHPITIDLPEVKRHPDELYHGLAPAPGARFRVLMSAMSDKENGGSGRREPMAMVLRHGEGRVFHCTLGHVWPGDVKTKASLDDPALRLLYARGTEWAATGRCTLKALDFGVTPRECPAGRPQDPFVFRCVLDGRPRMLVAALHDRLWTAYDAARGAFHSAWPGGMVFDGSVYTGAHGPQPESTGTPYRRGSDRPWTIRAAGGEAADFEAVEFLGYRFENDRFVLSLRLHRRGAPAHEAIVVEERPEIVSVDPVHWQRDFRARGIPEGFEILLRPDDTEGADPVVIRNGATRITHVLRLKEDP